MNETWASRDLPVLTAIAEVFERTGRAMRPNEIVEQSALGDARAEAALRALESEDPPFISRLKRRAAGGISLVGRPTGHARRATCQRRTTLRQAPAWAVDNETASAGGF